MIGQDSQYQQACQSLKRNAIPQTEEVIFWNQANLLTDNTTEWM